MMAYPAFNPSQSFRPAAIAPTYNNAPTLLNVLNRLEETGLPVFVINDGSTDSTASILNSWRQKPYNRYILTHEKNLGKAAALRCGFDAARAMGFSHAISIDTDGQLAPEDIPRMTAAAGVDPGALILGARDEQAAAYPVRSRLGRRVSNLLIRWECGQRVADSQCGLRVYPLDLGTTVQCRAGYFGFETEIIVRAAWDGVNLKSVPVSCRYFAPDQRISHFKPWRDSFRAVAMHVRLLADALTNRSRKAGELHRRESCEMRPLVPVRGAAE